MEAKSTAQRSPEAVLSPHDRRKLALEALTTEKTIRRAYAHPGSVREATLLRLRDAARRLGLPVPPEADGASGRDER